MIANITQGCFLGPLLKYHNDKVNSHEASIIDVGGVVFQHSLKNAESRIAGLGYNSKLKDKFFHVSLNFPPDDINVLSNDVLKNIAKEYIKGVGFDSDHPYIVYKHKDTIHPHIHIVTSKIDVNGRCNAKANNYRQSQRLTRELEKKYNLTKVSSQKKQIIVPQKISHLCNLRDRLNFHLKYAFEQYRVKNYRELQVYLNENHLDITTISGTSMVGDKMVSYEGIIFNDMSGDFRQNQKGIKASALYLKPTKKNLDIIFNKNKESYKVKKEHIKKVLDYTFSKYDKISLDDLKTILLKKNIVLNFKKDANDKLVGISFSDATDGFKFTGENLGKGYTAKNIVIFIGEKTITKPSELTKVLFLKYKDSIVNSVDRIKEIENLIKLGFNVQLDKNNLYISDYNNSMLKDFALLRRNVEDVTPEAIQLIKKTYSLNFNDLSNLDKLSFKYNRAKADNDLPKVESIKLKMESLNKLNIDDNDGFSKNISQNKSNELFNDVIETQQIDHIQNDDGISDADKKKKKDPFKKRKRRL